MARVSPFFEAFLDGFTGGSLFFEAKHPGIPDRLFVPEAEEDGHSSRRVSEDNPKGLW